MDKKNICPFCEHAIPQKNNGLGLVDCQCKGYGNACQTVCGGFHPNERLSRLKEAAIDAIKEYERLRLTDGKGSKAAVQRAAIRSCTMTEAFAIMLDIDYDDAEEMMWEWAEKDEPQP